MLRDVVFDFLEFIVQIFRECRVKLLAFESEIKLKI